MRFYRMDYSKLMRLPIKTFWALDDCIGRVSAEEQQQSFMTVAGANAAEQTDRQEYFERLTNRVGKVFVLDESAIARQAIAEAEVDIDGLNELRSLGSAR